MGKLIGLFFLIGFNLVFSQINSGVWVNKNLQEAILKNSLEKEDLNTLMPVLIMFKHNMVARFMRTEPAGFQYKPLKKVKKNVIESDGAEFTFINDSTLVYKTNKKELIFKKSAKDQNDMYDVNKIRLTKGYIDFSKISSIENTFDDTKKYVKCHMNNDKVECMGDDISFSYRITCGDPYYFKKWRKLEYYMHIEINKSKQTYLIERQDKYFNLKDLSSNKIIYQLK